MVERLGIRIGWAGVLVVIALLFGCPQLAWALPDDEALLADTAALVDAESGEPEDAPSAVDAEIDDGAADADTSESDGPVDQDAQETEDSIEPEDSISETQPDAAIAEDAVHYGIPAEAFEGERDGKVECLRVVEPEESAVRADAPVEHASAANADQVGHVADSTLEAPKRKPPKHEETRAGQPEPEQAGAAVEPSITVAPVLTYAEQCDFSAAVDSYEPPESAPACDETAQPPAKAGSPLRLAGTSFPGNPEAVEVAVRRGAEGSSVDAVAVLGETSAHTNDLTGFLYRVAPLAAPAVPYEKIRCRSP